MKPVDAEIILELLDKPVSKFVCRNVEELIGRLREREHIKLFLCRLPPLDVEPVKHGYWIDDFMDFICSECGEHSEKKTPGCPYCRSKMDKEEKHETD